MYLYDQPVPGKGVNYTGAALTGLLGAVVGSIVSTRIMLAFTAKVYGREQPMIDGGTLSLGGKRVRPVRAGGTGTRFMSALLDGGMDGVKMGVSIIPGVLVICTVVMMLTNGPAESGLYTGAAYEGIGLLPKLADKLSFILTPLFGFSSPEGLAVPVTALGAAGAAISLVPQLLAEGKAAGGDIAVFTAMCMCWSGYLSTHVSMMNSLGCNHLIGKAIHQPHRRRPVRRRGGPLAVCAVLRCCKVYCICGNVSRKKSSRSSNRLDFSCFIQIRPWACAARTEGGRLSAEPGG